MVVKLDEKPGYPTPALVHPITKICTNEVKDSLDEDSN